MHGTFLEDIGKSIVAAALIGFPSIYFGIPLILAYIITGIILGPNIGLGIIQNSSSISNLSEIGLVLLMFILGLEINLKKLVETGRTVLLSGLAQILGTLLLGYGLFSALGYSGSNYNLLYLTFACALSSTLIVVKILSDRMDLDALPSRITLGTLVLQDIAAIAFLAIQPNLTNLNVAALSLSFAKIGVLVITAAVLARYILPRVFKRAGKVPELMLVLAMGWCFAMCGLANSLKLSLEMGALVAGISIASFPYHLDVAAKISTLRDFFLTLFFLSLGMQIPIPSAEILALSGVIVIFTLSTRIITIFPALHKMGYGNRASLLPAINLSQVSEFSLVLASLGLAHKHISPDLMSAFIIALTITALISSFAIPEANHIYKILNPLLLRLGFKDHITKETALDNTVNKKFYKIVFLGFHRDASSLIYELQKRYSAESMDDLLVLDFNPEAHQELTRQKINCRYGDIANSDTLRSLNLQQANLIISTIPDKFLVGTTNLKILQMVKSLAPESHIIVTGENLALAKEMYRLGASFVYTPRTIGADFLADIIEKIQTEGADTVQKEALSQLTQRQEIIP